MNEDDNYHQLRCAKTRMHIWRQGKYHSRIYTQSWHTDTLPSIAHANLVAISRPVLDMVISAQSDFDAGQGRNGTLNQFQWAEGFWDASSTCEMFRSCQDMCKQLSSHTDILIVLLSREKINSSSMLISMEINTVLSRISAPSRHDRLM